LKRLMRVASSSKLSVELFEKNGGPRGLEPFIL